MRDLAQVLSDFGVTIASLEVENLRIDSRAIEPGDCFVALQGHTQNGAKYAASALAQGAKCVLAETGSELNAPPEQVIFIDNLAEKVAAIAAKFYCYPSKKLKLTGVTGTNGKSTTTAMIANLATLVGGAGAVIGTLGYGQPEALIPLENTTPSNVDLQRILACLNRDYKQVAMEVSSHGLVQGRVDECDFDVAVFTNLSRDHLDYHGDMDSYAEAKRLLFTRCAPNYKVINLDDEVGASWAQTFDDETLVVYGRWHAEHRFEQFVFFDAVSAHPNGLTAMLKTSWGECEVNVPLYGEFNLYNLAAAFATLLIQGESLESLAQACSKLSPVAGRMQPFSAPEQPTCIVDYAHTPDALALALQALRQHVPGELICVFGCGGDRDKGKRPEMARAAEKFADKLVITSDNPRSEDPNLIIDDVKAGLIHSEYAVCQPDRGLAIQHAIDLADENSVVLIAGKGHEDYQIIGTERIDFCDRQCVAAILKGEKA
ncbi:UDP-N-acetylmuramoyl-L-alanyl-D-glutamate--2,6-diaminopimelate ligase [Pseudoalteromonas piscicida]|uniref:UDP-N-acetylmuramoyl-L-alanyl-D-glutamate--2,6-diaminopimelate ligase n=1 Tax=Pseudoalteromonas piscicida TaxID=43662 RepID=A0A2A5JVP2_PSEO7|nr:UDP-N-acetylmuramoyl-L-alanyl-D-glutamate--2,6-diaminopimelate ligase [Pseudoalteromonas piscicida]PCK33563.1 UDP-N-acetylmuramoyl-L-alanyl-D-glutamate--2,6-diaminopimelate ligase [Pseudoalteromonas piscicida]